MLRCRFFVKDLTAWIDGALDVKRSARVARHVARCVGCTREAADLRMSIAHQTDLLHVVTATDEVSPELLWMRLQGALATQAEATTQSQDDSAWGWRGNLMWRRLMVPAALAGVVVSIAMVLLLHIGPPETLLIAFGVESPPPMVARQTELFMDYPLIQELDALENFDTVEAVPLDDERSHDG